MSTVDPTSGVCHLGLATAGHATVPRMLVARSAQVAVGLALFGVSLALMVRARLGLSPWDVLHQGIATRTGVSIGWVVIGVGALVLLAWLPLRQRPGAGTVANVVVVGLAANATLSVMPVADALPARIALLAVGIVANAVATGLYIGAGLGPGPRDGLMTGLAKRGYSIRTARTAVELSVLVVGVALGGTVGAGTVAYALAIGPLAQRTIPMLTIGRIGRRAHAPRRRILRRAEAA